VVAVLLYRLQLLCRWLVLYNFSSVRILFSVLTAHQSYLHLHSLDATPAAPVHQLADTSPCSFGLISRISSHPVVFFSHNKSANSAFSTINQRNEHARRPVVNGGQINIFTNKISTSTPSWLLARCGRDRSGHSHLSRKLLLELDTVNAPAMTDSVQKHCISLRYSTRYFYFWSTVCYSWREIQGARYRVSDRPLAPTSACTRDRSGRF
jgi:hypothetical protein